MIEYDPIFGKNVIETLSEGMYDNPMFLFREYVQNSADAIDASIRQGILKENEGQIEITINAEKRLLSFEDNGIGIKHDDVLKMLANIGDSPKDRKTDKGFRGIGRLGGLGYCQKIRFKTSFKGEPTASILEWDARNLHEILADKNEKISAGQLIKRITSIWEESCSEESHFFIVTLINVAESSIELLDVGEVSKYLQMVAPVPFDYAKFPFVKKIEKFITNEKLPNLHEYRLNINGDEIRKGYETPLTIDDGKRIDVFDIVCKKVISDERVIGWYWFCVSKFEGVLPPKCWQRNIRLRKLNIQIGEADCLSNHPKRGQALWKEDRGNNYFLGEVHVLDEYLTPNSRRDYFNQDDACRRFESVIQKEFFGLYQLYKDASDARSAYNRIHDASKAQKEFEVKEKKGKFYDPKDRDKEQEKVVSALEKAKEAKRTIDKIENKLESDKKESAPLAQIVGVYKNESKDIFVHDFEPATNPKKGYAKDEVKKNVKDVLDIVFEVLNKMLPENEATPIREAIIKKVIVK